MKKRILLLCCFISAILSSNAQSWMKQNLGFKDSAYFIEKISIVDNNTAWGVTGYFSPLKMFGRTTDGGATWNYGTITTSATLRPTCLAAVDSLTAYVSMETPVGDTILKTTDGGLTWNPSGAGVVFNNASSFVDGIYFWDAAHGLAFGDPVNGYNEFFTTSDSGNTWVQVLSPDLPANTKGSFYAYSPYCVIGNTIWILTSVGELLKSTDKGLHWTLTAIGGITFFSISFLDQLNGIVISPSYFYRTTDGGNTWNAFTPTGSTPKYNTVAIPGTTYYVDVESYLTVNSSYSPDMGNTWVPIDSVHKFYALAFKDMGTGFAGGDLDSVGGGIYKWNRGTIGISETKTKSFLLYPNPTTNILNITCDPIAGGKYQLQLSSMLGQVVYSSEAGSHVQIEMKDLPAGIYFLTLTSENKRETYKIQKL